MDSSSKDIISTLFRHGPMGRRELHQRTGLHPNTVGRLATRLLEAKVIRSLGTHRRGRGRPKEPLELDPQSRSILGIALRPGSVQILRLNLLGHWLEEPRESPVGEPGRLICVASSLVRRNRVPGLLALGLSIPGFVDPEHQRILFSAAAPTNQPIDLTPIFKLAGDLPLVMDNDLHAVGAQWQLQQETDSKQDVLLVTLADGAVGSSMMIQGQANPGCILAGNELGHMRLNVKTPRCYCGGIGCLERVFSSAFLHEHHGPHDRTLAQCLHPYQKHFPAVKEITDLTGTALANVVNLIRPHQLILAGQAAGWAEFHEPLISAIQKELLPELNKRVHIAWWNDSGDCAAEAAGWLALRSIMTNR